jgi:predicted choloylglycine hydrolase
VIRYVLEVCDTTEQARAVLARLPVHMAYNVTVVDRAGDYLTAFLGPDREPGFVRQLCATNHQEHLDWPEQAQATRSQARQAVITGLLDDPAVDLHRLVASFLRPPLYSTTYELGFGTLYTAVYRPAELAVEYHWPGSSWRHAVGRVGVGTHGAVLGAGPGAAQVPM